MYQRIQALDIKKRPEQNERRMIMNKLKYCILISIIAFSLVLVSCAVEDTEVLPICPKCGMEDYMTKSCPCCGITLCDWCWEDANAEFEWAYKEGIEAGYETGYDEGYVDSHYEWYEEGYADGYYDAEQDMGK